MVINLSLFQSGSETCLNYIPPGVSGIYSWFQNFKYQDDPESLFNSLIEDIERPKFTERSGVISPYYHVGIRSFGKISDSKRKRLKEALYQEDFRRHFQHALGNAILFQSPLYVGKASDLQVRVRQHLASDSVLRNRLNAVGINIDQALLMICPIWGEAESNEYSNQPQEDLPSLDECIPELLDESSSMDQQEDLFEEVFSRLFSPQFSIRLG